MEKTDWKRIGWLTAATLVLGAIIGACAGLLTLLLYGVEYMMLGFIESEFIPGAFTVPAVRRIASVTLGLASPASYGTCCARRPRRCRPSRRR